MKVILASGSPRRSEILKLAGYEFDVVPSSADETMGSGELCDNVMELAGRKAREVASGHPAALVIGADTVVSCGGEIMGKPGDGEDAVRMLKELSGKRHIVYTGVCVCCVERGIEHRFYDATEVEFYEMDGGEISKYVASGEPMDKAGAYAVQGMGSVFVKGIEGDFFNVMGFPISKFYHEMKRLGIDPRA